MHVPLLNAMDSQHQAPLADVAEWLSQNLQNDMQGEAMASSPTHASRWGPLAPAGIVESKCFLLTPFLSNDTIQLCQEVVSGKVVDDLAAT